MLVEMFSKIFFRNHISWDVFKVLTSKFTRYTVCHFSSITLVGIMLIAKYIMKPTKQNKGNAIFLCIIATLMILRLVFWIRVVATLT